MRKIYFIIFLFLNSFLFGENILAERQKSNLLQYLINEGETQDLFVLDSFRGRFLSKNRDDYLIFLDHKNRQKGLPKRISKTIVVHFNESDMISDFYVIPYSTIQFKENCEHQTLGEGITQGWIRDFNENGLDELLFTESSGSYMIWEIFEFQEGRFKKTFDFPYNITIKDNNFDKKSITIVHHLYSETKGYYKDITIDFFWDEKRKKYLNDDVK